MTGHHQSVLAREMTSRYDAKTGLLAVGLSKAASERLGRALRAIAVRHDGDDQSHVTHLRQIGFEVLPPDLLALFDDIRAGVLEPTALLIEDLPCDAVTRAPAPSETPRDRKPSDLSDNLTVMIGAMIAEPYGLFGEGERLVNDLVPSQEDRLRTTGNGSEVRLGPHTENAAHRWLFWDRDLSPLGLVLVGVCAPLESAPGTWLANGRLAAANLDTALSDVLRAPAVELALPLRQRREGRTVRTPPRPVLTGPLGRETVTVALYGDMTKPVHASACAALTAFEQQLEAVSIRLVIRPGMAVYVPNGYTLHARDAFLPTFDAEGRADRWLQRVFVTGRLDGFRGPDHNRCRVFELPR